MAIALTGCAMTKGQQQQPNQQVSSASTQKKGIVQTQQKDQQAFDKASQLTQGWPEASTKAAKDMITKYGAPAEATSQMLVWRGNVAPFKEIIVHKEVYTHNFPFLHKDTLEHVVEYQPKVDKVDDVLRYNGAIVFNKIQGEMSSFSNSEAMNILALNLADKIMNGQMGAEAARVKLGKEYLNYVNGEKAAMTSVLNFGTQFQTADQDKPITDQIRWVGDPDRKQQTREAQEEKPKKKK